jgi:hypothetical protein
MISAAPGERNPSNVVGFLRYAVKDPRLVFGPVIRDASQAVGYLGQVYGGAMKRCWARSAVPAAFGRHIVQAPVRVSGGSRAGLLNRRSRRCARDDELLRLPPAGQHSRSGDRQARAQTTIHAANADQPMRPVPVSATARPAAEGRYARSQRASASCVTSAA